VKTEHTFLPSTVSPFVGSQMAGCSLVRLLLLPPLLLVASLVAKLQHLHPPLVGFSVAKLLHLHLHRADFSEPVNPHPHLLPLRPLLGFSAVPPLPPLPLLPLLRGP
jgi:hypothetical protein